MPLSPPSDFQPPTDGPRTEPTQEDLRALWDEHERRRAERARAKQWQERCARQHDVVLPALLWHDTAKKRFRVVCVTT